MTRSHQLTKALVISAWTIFAAAVFLLDWQGASALYWTINLVGLAGLVVAIAWAIRGHEWIGKCIGLSAIFVFLYFLQWALQIRELYYSSPHDGLPTAIYRLAAAWHALFVWRASKFGAGWALLGMYWDFIVVLLQIVAVFVLARIRARKPVQS
jgi:hypothetical protein